MSTTSPAPQIVGAELPDLPSPRSSGNRGAAAAQQAEREVAARLHDTPAVIGRKGMLGGEHLIDLGTEADRARAEAHRARALHVDTIEVARARRLGPDGRTLGTIQAEIETLRTRLSDLTIAIQKATDLLTGKTRDAWDRIRTGKLPGSYAGALVGMLLSHAIVGILIAIEASAALYTVQWLIDAPTGHDAWGMLALAAIVCISTVVGPLYVASGIRGPNLPVHAQTPGDQLAVKAKIIAGALLWFAAVTLLSLARASALAFGQSAGVSLSAAGTTDDGPDWLMFALLFIAFVAVGALIILLEVKHERLTFYVSHTDRLRSKLDKALAELAAEEARYHLAVESQEIRKDRAQEEWILARDLTIPAEGMLAVETYRHEAVRLNGDATFADAVASATASRASTPSLPAGQFTGDPLLTARRES